MVHFFPSDKPDASFKSSAELKAKKFFQSCMDSDRRIEKLGGQPLLDLIDSQGYGVNIRLLVILCVYLSMCVIVLSLFH